MNNSIWYDNVKLPQFNQLKGKHKTDILIVGGGICGLLCAYYLDNLNINYMLVEGKKICSGVTENTTAKITSQHGLIYHKLIKNYGEELSKMYLDANNDALREYIELSRKFTCDFEVKKAFTYSLYNRKIIENEVKAVNKLGYKAVFDNYLELPFRTAGAICFDGQAQFNSMKFLSAIVDGLSIYEDTFIYDIDKNTAYFQGGTINAKKILITTHFPFMNRFGGYFLKLYQHRSYVSAFENAPKFSGMYVDENLNGLSFRSYNDYLLIGGGSHRTGKSGGSWTEINSFAKQYYPEATIKYRWATQDCMSLDSIPYIGRYSKNTPDMYVATGFNKWGMTSAMAAAKILTDMVVGKKNQYEKVFSPQRSMLKPQLLVNSFESTVNLITPTVRRCSHLGCALKWNKYEHTWDCACHGSRFTKDGKIINNPAQKDIFD